MKKRGECMIPMSSQGRGGSAHLFSSSPDEFDRDSLRVQWKMSQAAQDLISRFFDGGE